MKTITGMFGALFIISSFLLFFFAVGLSSRPNAPVGFLAVLAIISLIAGIPLYRSANRKRCPKCAETVKLKAKVCRHCSHQF